MKKLIFLPAVIILLAVSFFLIYRLSKNQSGTWTCQDGLWLAQGSPRGSMPSTPCPQNSNADSSDRLIGGDQDVYGCLIAAGYSWCEAKEKCLRPWEEFCGPLEFEPIFTFLNQIKADTGIEFSAPQPGSFDWNLQQTPSTPEPILIPGLSQTTLNTTNDEIINQYFQNQGYSIDPANASAGTSGNITGYIKDQTICLVSQVISEIDTDEPTTPMPANPNHLNLTIACGYLPG